MNNLQQVLYTLTHQRDGQNYFQLAKDFARSTGWNPSYFIKSEDDDFANGHLAVEHGLENTAILTFLKRPYEELTYDQKQKLFNLSYNNLVDWHIPIDDSRITYLYTRTELGNSIIDSHRITADNHESLRIEAFEKIIGKRPTPNTPALDIVLAETISLWKRRISIELYRKINNDDLASLFNSLIFVRALEDNLKRHKRYQGKQILLESYLEIDDEDRNIFNILKRAKSKLGYDNIPEDFLNETKLRAFDSYNRNELFTLLKNFYVNNVNAFFYYDFSIISQHALSRIYEKYVALLKVEDEIQGNLFGANSPEEKINKTSGTYYTPQYIARFFAKLISKEFSNPTVSPIKVLEPSVGSGIFLRSLLELQIDSISVVPTVDELEAIFSNVTGIDIDPNAVLATKLSLSLLYLIFSDSFPQALNIITADSVDELSKIEHQEYYDVVVSNPPFIRVENRDQETKERFTKHLGESAFGKSDEYLLFLDKAIKALKPGGLGLFVLPHSFLINNSSKRIRELIFENCTIKYLADLTAIPVFENTGVYVVLIVFQKKSLLTITSEAIILKCRSSVGKALEHVVNKNFIDQNAFSIYSIPQNYFRNEYWFVLAKREMDIKTKLESFPAISKFLETKQGFVTGADDIFIVGIPPKGEGKIYNYYLPDKEIYQYGFEKKSLRYVFYPYIDGKKITETELKEQFPNTWAHLQRHRHKLSKRASLGKRNWWEPINPRMPEYILSPKIITPHLVFVPKFAIDLEGNITTSHSPYLYLSNDLDSELLYYFLGMLNSSPCFWYISSHSHKYGGSYNRLEVATLKNTPIPDPSTLNHSALVRFINLIKQRLNSKQSDKIYRLENEIDMLACQFYGLTKDEIQLFHGNLNYELTH